jgi:hypothetical protein
MSTIMPLWQQRWIPTQTFREMMTKCIMPLETPANAEEYLSTAMEHELYGEIKRLTTVLRKVGNFLQTQHPDLIRTMQKMSLFDETVDDPDMESGSSHGSFCKTSDATVHTGNTNTPL